MVTAQPTETGSFSRYGVVTAQEKLWRLRFAVGVMLVTTLPYFIGFARQNADWQFTGFVFGIEDGNSYIAKMLSGATGSWLFRTPYTTAPQAGVIAYLPYILLGKLSSPPGQHDQLVVLYHLFRFGAGILTILATYDFSALFIFEIRLRRLAVALSTLGGGVGWLLVISGKSDWMGSLPLDFYSPESFGFLALYGLPHIALARALLLWGLCGYLRIEPSEASRSACFSAAKIGHHPGLLWLMMGFCQPLIVVIAWVILGTHLTWMEGWQMWRKLRLRAGEWQEWWSYFRRASAMVLLSAPIVIYTLVAFSTDPFLRQWTAQNIIRSPHPLHYLAAYGLLLPFSLLGAYRLLRLPDHRGWLLVGWIFCLPLLAYAPHNLQRRFPEGIWVAFAILAAASFESHGTMGISLSNRLRSILYLSFGSTTMLLIGGSLAVVRPAEPAFRPRAEVVVFSYLAEHARPGEGVLAAYNTGNALPAWAPVRVVIGHGPESVGLSEKSEQVKRFFAAEATDDERERLLDKEHVRYLIYGPDESRMGEWDPRKAPFLSFVFQHSDYLLFETQLEIIKHALPGKGIASQR
jgi:hypothetical protein